MPSGRQRRLAKPNRPSVTWLVGEAGRRLPSAIRGLIQQPSWWQPQLQVLRNQSVGSRSAAGSGPRLAAVIRMRMSSGPPWRIGENVEIAARRRTRPYRSARIPGFGGRVGGFPRPARRKETGLRVAVQGLHLRVRGRGIEVVVELLDVLAVVALRIGQAEEALFKDRIAVVPKRQARSRGGIRGR